MAEFEPRETYGSGYILFTHVEKALQELGGRVVVHVVEEINNEKSALVYALFYKDKHDRAFDVLQQRNAELKTFARADTLVSALARIGLQDHNNIPALVKSNIIRKGELRTAAPSGVSEKAAQR